MIPKMSFLTTKLTLSGEMGNSRLGLKMYKTTPENLPIAIIGKQGSDQRLY